MPKLSPKLKKIRDKRFLTALERTGSTKEAALEVLNIGSLGSKDIDNSARAAGSQALARIKPTLLEAYERKGITADKLADKNNLLLDSDELQYVDKGLDKAIKVGIGGGYAAEKTINTNVNINSSPEEITKFQKLREEYENKLLKEIGK